MDRKYSRKLIIHTDTNRWSAVCRGAVIRASESKGEANISKRILRYHYGSTTQVKFEEGFHDPRDYYYCDIEGEPRARNQMDWYLNMVRITNTFESTTNPNLSRTPLSMTTK
jgi:hypothetical protein